MGPKHPSHRNLPSHIKAGLNQNRTLSETPHAQIWEYYCIIKRKVESRLYFKSGFDKGNETETDRPTSEGIDTFET